MLILISVCVSLILGYAFITLQSSWHFGRLSCINNTSDYLFVSVIVPARNEADNIEACLHSILAQNYSQDKFELILVNDHSSDSTLEIAQEIASHSSNLRIINLADHYIKGSKKAALKIGIEHSKGEIILQTDADCVAGPNWISAINRQFNKDTGMVAGPVLLSHTKSLLSKFQTLEYIGLAGLTAGSIAANRPNMCNGANLAFRKEAFIKVKGYEGIDHIASGDDELLMQKISMHPQYKIAFAKCKDAIVETPALESWSELKAQRLRWVSKARYYINSRVNALQILFYLAFCTFPLLLFISFFDLRALIAFGGNFLIKLLADTSLLIKGIRFFDKKELIFKLPLLQPVYILYVLWIGIAGNRVNTYNWKGRKVI